MTECVIMPKADYQAVCNAMREKTGGTEPIRSGELAGLIAALNPDGQTDTAMEVYLSGEDYALHLPEGITVIKDYAFDRDADMTALHLPESVLEIGVEAFRGCTQLQSATIPAGVTLLGYRAFGYNTALKTVRFRGTPDAIRSDVFYNSGVTDIYVPWAENAIPNAPWGAVSATIHYRTEVEE